MSFSSQVKEELNSLQIKGNCCKKAYILGALASAEISDGFISVRITDSSTVEQLCHYLKSIYKIEPDRREIKRGCFSATELRFKSAKISEFLSFADEFSGSDEDIEALQGYFSCDNCKKIFARAAFCASGSISDPKKSYSFEIHTKGDTRVLIIHSILEEIVSEAKIAAEEEAKNSIFVKEDEAKKEAQTIAEKSKGEVKA